MKAIIPCWVLIVLPSLLQGPCCASFFEMAFKRDSIYTPGDMGLVIRLTDKAIAEGEYSFMVSVFIGGETIRKQVLPVAGGEAAIFELSFPQMRARTTIRCRAELFINGQFMEAQEKPLTLWPPLAPGPKQPKDKVIWVFDTSGALQRIFKDLQVDTTDATFQAVRDFQTPNIVFVGEDTDRRDFQTLATRTLSEDENLEVIVFLRQREFPEDWLATVAPAKALLANISCDPNSPMLLGLNKLDVMKMVSNTLPVKMIEPRDREWEVDSYIEWRKDDKRICSYLAVVKDKDLTAVYCQLPLTGAFYEDPRSAVILSNLLRFAYESCTPQKN